MQETYEREYISESIRESFRDGRSSLYLNDVPVGEHLDLLEELRRNPELRRLALCYCQLTEVPSVIAELKQLELLELAGNEIERLPDWLCELHRLEELSVEGNQLGQLPVSLGQLTRLSSLSLEDNKLRALPESLCDLHELTELYVHGNEITCLPARFGNLKTLVELSLDGNQLSDLPASFSRLANLKRLWLGDEGGNPFGGVPLQLRGLAGLRELYIDSCGVRDLPDWLLDLVNLTDLSMEGNPLDPELAAAYEDGLGAIREYLKAKEEESVVLNEAKLIMVGEGGVGKTSLLSALRGDPWVEDRETTHGVEIDIQTLELADESSGTEITFNAWDFGGQDIYKHTHQLFFTAPAVYLAVWDPRGGAESCRVGEWIKLVKHRAYDEEQHERRPRIFVVATHGGPKERQAHIDEVAIREEFGDMIVGFHHVDSRPDDSTGERAGIDNLKRTIAATALDIPQVGREVPVTWSRVLRALRKRSQRDPYITFKQFQALCRRHRVTNERSHIYAAILNELGHLVRYRDDADLEDTVILKPEWLSKAMSYVVEDRRTMEQHGLVEHSHLAEIWDDPEREARDRYPRVVHPIFLRLMEQFDLSYRVVMPQRDATDTSLIAQLVPGNRPDGWEVDWPPEPAPGDSFRTQVCRFVDTKTGRTVEVEGLLYRLIVRLHRYSLGRRNYNDSRHWKTGVILDDGFNGRAFVEELRGDVRVTVRAAYPERMLAHLCSEIEWLVDHFWRGLECRVSVPCHEPCLGLHEVEELIETRREGIEKVRCSVCKQFLEIDSLLATVVPKPPIEEALEQLKNGQKLIRRGVSAVGTDLRRLIGQVNEQFDLLMAALIDPAKDGPRLFSFIAVDPKFWQKPKWMAERFRLTLWCEHARLPLPVITGDERAGVYDIELTREWVKKAAPFLRVLTSTLSLALPVASSAAKLAIDAATYKALENQLDFGKTCATAFIDAGAGVTEWLSEEGATELASGRGVRAHGAALRELHSILQAKDPASQFGGLVRVQTKRREFLWVHPQFESEYK